MNRHVVHDSHQHATPRSPELFASSVRGLEGELHLEGREHPVSDRDVVAEQPLEEPVLDGALAVTPIGARENVAGSESGGLPSGVGIPDDLDGSSRFRVDCTRGFHGSEGLVLNTHHVNALVAILVQDDVWPDGIIEVLEHLEGISSRLGGHVVEFLGALHRGTSLADVEKELLPVKFGFCELLCRAQPVDGLSVVAGCVPDHRLDKLVILGSTTPHAIVVSFGLNRKLAMVRTALVIDHELAVLGPDASHLKVRDLSCESLVVDSLEVDAEGF